MSRVRSAAVNFRNPPRMGRLSNGGRKADRMSTALVPHGRATGALNNNSSFADYLIRMQQYGTIENAPKTFLRNLLGVVRKQFGEGHVWVRGITNYLNPIPAPRIADIPPVNAENLAGRELKDIYGANTSAPNSYTAPLMMRMDPKTGRSVDTAQVIQDRVRYGAFSILRHHRFPYEMPYSAPVNRYSPAELRARGGAGAGWLPPWMLYGDQPNQYVRNSHTVPLAGPSRPLRELPTPGPPHHVPEMAARRAEPVGAGYNRVLHYKGSPAQQYNLAQPPPGVSRTLRNAVPGRPIGIAPPVAGGGGGGGAVAGGIGGAAWGGGALPTPQQQLAAQQMAAGQAPGAFFDGRAHPPVRATQLPVVPVAAAWGGAQPHPWLNGPQPGNAPASPGAIPVPASGPGPATFVPGSAFDILHQQAASGVAFNNQRNAAGIGGAAWGGGPLPTPQQQLAAQQMATGQAPGAFFDGRANPPFNPFAATPPPHGAGATPYGGQGPRGASAGNNPLLTPIASPLAPGAAGNILFPATPPASPPSPAAAAAAVAPPVALVPVASGSKWYWSADDDNFYRLTPDGAGFQKLWAAINKRKKLLAKYGRPVSASRRSPRISASPAAAPLSLNPLHRLMARSPPFHRSAAGALPGESTMKALLISSVWLKSPSKSRPTTLACRTML